MHKDLTQKLLYKNIYEQKIDSAAMVDFFPFEDCRGVVVRFQSKIFHSNTMRLLPLLISSVFRFTKVFKNCKLVTL